MRPLTQTQINRFWFRVWKKGPDDCWLWTGGCFSNGYGSVSFYEVSYGTHVVACQLSNSDYDPSLLVMHTCDNRRCCNPGHLVQGTIGDNNRDCLEKGRGNRNPPIRTSLLDSEIPLIRELGQSYGPRAISRMPEFIGRISEKGIGHILLGNSWKGDDA